MFHFPNEIDWNHFFRFDKRWIENMNWARISPAAKAVFPVIACHCSEAGISFPGEEVISGLSGLTAKSVRKAIHDLEGFPGYDWEYYLTRRGKRGKRFQITFPPKGEKGRSFFFYRVVIDGGTWRKRNDPQSRSGLTPTAQALYPVMRYFARYDFYECQDDDSDLSDIDEHYKNRQWELCSAEVCQLAKYAGINRHAVPGAMQNLKENFLIEPHTNESGERIWKVYLVPQKYWKASFLNKKLRSEACAQ